MASLGAFFLVVAGMGAYWWTHQGSAWFAQGKVAFEDGRALGHGGDNHLCLDRSLDRFGGCEGMGCEIGVVVFLNACLSEATPDAGFCEGIPTEIAVFDSISWRRQRCDAAGHGGEVCEQLFGSIQGYCDSQRLYGFAKADP